ncbi:MAG: response regulator [Bdellovibrionaceae bacterium]|nr:response regulator [Pseudobdellovibrionaceae bacterium]
MDVEKSTKKRVLVVDATETTRHTIIRALRSSGYETLEAVNGIQALALATIEKPDLITLDIYLPDINGLEVCRQIKANPRTSYIPVLQVADSCNTSKEQIHGLEGGADSYLSHPFDPPVLLATIKALLRGRQLMDELWQTDERFKIALKYAPIMIYTIDKHLRYTWVYNPPDQLSPDFFINKFDYDIFPDEEAQKLHAVKTEVLATGVGQHVTLPLTLNRKKHCYDMTIEAQLSVDGYVEGLTVACIEITERIKAEEAQKQALEEAEFANQSKTRFLSNMSHEIRTPLGIIEGFADLALSPSISNEERNTYLKTIKRNAMSLTKLLGEILDLAKVEAGRMEIEIARFSLRILLNELIEAFGLNARNRGLLLQVHFEEPFPESISSDPTRVRQILTNLISNALKFTERGGVQLTARVLGSDDPDRPANIEIVIRDSGIGMTLAQQKKLFQPFVQADSSTTRKFGGTGLGLNLSQKLAHSLGGNLELESSDYGRGSVFKFTMDAGLLTAEDYADLGKVAEAMTDGSSRFENSLLGFKILLVEDSVDNQMLFSRYLQNVAAEIEIANDGLEALEKLNHNSYDVVLMDIQMPNLDGYETTQILRRQGLRTPIIALTAHALKEERDRALNMGFDDYLTKPLNVRLLVEMLIRYRQLAEAKLLADTLSYQPHL